MKKLIIVLATVCAFISIQSCKQQTQDFKVTFDIRGVESDMASYTVFGLRDSVTVDVENPKKPYIPVTDGKFTFSGKAAQQAVIRVTFPKDKRLFKYVKNGYFPNKATSMWFVVGPGTDLTVTGDITDKKYVDVFPTGDRENKKFAQFASAYMPVQSLMGDYMVQAEVDSTLTPDQRKEIGARIDSLEQVSQKMRMEWITDNPSCMAGLWLMEDMLIRSQVETEYLEPLLEKVDKKYHDNYFYYSVKGRVEGAKLAAVGAQCPRLEGTDVNGNPFNIKDMFGKYTIIDFWGTWCSACLAGMPAMKAFRDSHADKVQIVGVANDKDLQMVKECMESHGMDWINILQGKGEDDFVAKFNVQGFPTKIVLDPRGKIVYRASGESEEFYKEVEAIINK